MDQMEAASLAAMEEFLREYDGPKESIPCYSDDTDVDTANSDVESSSSPSNEDSPRVCSGQEAVGHDPKLNQRMTRKRRGISSEKAAKRRLRYLTKVKDERKTLKEQEQKLTEELGRLQRKQKPPKVHTGPVDTLALSAWKCIAVRHREQRLEAEEQQLQLKGSLAHQEKLIHQLTESLRQYFVCRPVSPPSFNSFEYHTPDTMTAFVFKTLTRELGLLYASTSDVTSGADLLPLTPLQLQLDRTWNEEKTALVTADTTIIPVGLEQACRVLSAAVLRSPPTSEITVDCSGSLARRYRLDYSQDLSDNSATLLIHSVVRRYVEADRVVFAWRALNEGQGKFAGMYTDESGWFVLRPSVEADSVTGSSVIMESYSRVVPIGFSEVTDYDERDNKFIEVLGKADEEDLNGITEAMTQLMSEDAQPADCHPHS